MAEYGNDAIVVFQPTKLNNKFEEPTSAYKGKAASISIRNFIVGAIRGKVGVMTPDLRPFFLQERPLLVVYYDLDLVVCTRSVDKAFLLPPHCQTFFFPFLLISF